MWPALVYRIWTPGASMTLDKLNRIRLRNVGNGVVRVYVEGGNGVDNLVYSCPAADGPTANA